MPHKTIRQLQYLISILALISSLIFSAETSLFTPVPVAKLDPATLAQWVDGKESPLAGDDAAKGAALVLWTDKGGPSHTGFNFGDVNSTGIRHLRIGFREPIQIGAVMVRGGGRLSVLKADAAYPGDLNKDADWLSAERIDNSSVGKNEVQRNDFAVWVLPKPMQVRAIRFTHEAIATDKTYAGWLGGLAIFDSRVVNLARFAVPTSNLDNGHPEYLNDGSAQRAWERFETYDKTPIRPEDIVSETNPSWVMLSWSKPVSLRAIAGLPIGALVSEVQVYSGPENQHPNEAREEDWKTIKRFEKLNPEYPRTLPLQWLDFGQTVTTRALRLRMLQPLDGKKLHQHLQNCAQEGRRVWIGELMAISSIGEAALADQIPPPEQEPHPPIAIKFKLAEPGYVTLTIDDANQRRIRNLVSETPFPAGENTAWWDGLDDLGRDPDAARHGLYNVPGAPVPPGDYQINGIWHKDVDLRYEFGVYTAGDPPWNTADKTGAWLANHTPPQAAVFVPAARGPGGKAVVYIGSYVSEGTHGLAWVDLDGKKLGGINWVGGNWTGAPYIARDDGPEAIQDHIIYVASVWNTGKGSADAELRLTAVTAKGEPSIYTETWPLPKSNEHQDNVLAAEISGFASRDHLLVTSLKRLQKLVVVDAKSKQRKSEREIKDPRGLAFDSQGRLLVLSGNQLVRIQINKDGTLGNEEIVVKSELEDPQHVVSDSDGKFYVTDLGQSHQIKVFDPSGKLVSTIGKKGPPVPGPYDETKMRHPAGLTLDDRGRIWVAENSNQPKRVSVWKLDGTFVRAFYGPAEYGGGGTLDPHADSEYHYHGMTFKSDWRTGASSLKNIYYPGPDAQELSFRANYPEAPLYRDGKRYWTNAYNSNPTGGSSAFVFVEHDGIAVAAAGCGRAANWDVLKTDAFRDRWPAPENPKGDPFKRECVFLWTDLNGDGHTQPEEVTIAPGQCGGVTVMNDLSIIVSRLSGKTMRLPVQKFTGKQIPVYDLKQAEVLAEGVEGPRSSGGDQALVHDNGWTVVTLGVAPFSPYSVCGVFKGQARWSYPNPWPGLHASHEAPVPDRPGEIIGTTRLLGNWVEPKGSDAGPLMFLNGNMGNMYVFTADGMFVRTLFYDARIGKPWAMPRAERGMRVNDLTLHDENFWPTIAQLPDGKIVLQNGGRSSLISVNGLETLRRLPPQNIHIGEAELKAAVEWRVQAEAARRRDRGTSSLVVALRQKTPTVDGKIDEWIGAQWASIDKRGTKANFNSNSKPYDLSAALTIADGKLFAAFKTDDKELLKNSGEQPLAPFKTGGALDIMLGTDPNADPNRKQPAAGDLRLLVTTVTDPGAKSPRTKALIYRAVVPGTAQKDRVPFSSPWRTIYFDRVDDISDKVTLAGQDGNYEFSVPLDAIGLKPLAGQKIKGDLGVLRGNAFQTNYRVYWMNKATAITADVPSEAELQPSLWGVFNFANEK